MTSVQDNKISDTEALFNAADKKEENSDFKAAFKLFLAAAKLGDSWSQVSVANYYSWGKGVRKDFDKAAYWYKRAYAKGNGCAARNLAIDRRNQGKTRSAVAWFKKAIAMDDGESCIFLAKICMTRNGGEKLQLSY